MEEADEPMSDSLERFQLPADLTAETKKILVESFGSLADSVGSFEDFSLHVLRFRSGCNPTSEQVFQALSGGELVVAKFIKWKLRSCELLIKGPPIFAREFKFASSTVGWLSATKTRYRLRIFGLPESEGKTLKEAFSNMGVIIDVTSKAQVSDIWFRW